MEEFFSYFTAISTSQFTGDVISLLMLYSVFKYLLVGVVTEMIWPTQLFNRMHSYLNDTIRFRTYTEYFSKLMAYSTFFFFFYSSVLGKYISYKVRNTL
jgi:hypothetical protein